MTPIVLTLALLMAHAPVRVDKTLSASEVVRRLDVTSFPSSIGPRRRPGAWTFRDYGVTRLEPKGRDFITLYERDKSWVFTIEVLGPSYRGTIVCMTDHALNGGSYYTQDPMEIEEGPGGLLRATDRTVTHPKCPVRRSLWEPR